MTSAFTLTGVRGSHGTFCVPWIRSGPVPVRKPSVVEVDSSLLSREPAFPASEASFPTMAQGSLPSFPLSPSPRFFRGYLLRKRPPACCRSNRTSVETEGLSSFCAAVKASGRKRTVRPSLPKFAVHDILKAHQHNRAIAEAASSNCAAVTVPNRLTNRDSETDLV